MSNVGEIERATQNRIVRLFRDHLGYQYLGNWKTVPITATWKKVCSATI